MTKSHSAQVIDRDGLRGTIESGSPNDTESVYIRLENGDRVLVPGELLETKTDGFYRLNVSLASLMEGRSDDSLRIPVIEERADVRRVETVTGKVRVDKTVRERIEQIDESLVSEEITVERVPINRPVDEAPVIRHEGNTLIIPLLEEVLVVEKRLVLREEVHVRRLRTEVRSPQEVSLRSEQIEITRQPVSPSDEQPIGSGA